MMRERSIIHLNIADFAVAVETSITPSLKNRPLIIAPQGAPRAVVYDMSETAYQEGIRKGMPLAKALRLNRKINILPPSFNRYELVMKDLLKQTVTYTPRIESGENDGHIFMDLTGSGRLFGPPADVAFRLKKAFKTQFGLDPIWSVATSKLVAKVATRIVKPIGEYIVAPGDEESFLSPLPVGLIPGIKPEDTKTLNEFNLFTISQVRKLTLEQLKIAFRQNADLIYDRIRGIDPSRVSLLCENNHAVRADHEFADDTNDAGQLKKALYVMVSRICSLLKQRNLHGTGTRLTLFYSDGMHSSAKLTIKPSTANDMVMFRRCTELLENAWTRRVRVRHMCLVCDKLAPRMVQSRLFETDNRQVKETSLAQTIDRIREKFGKTAVMPALTLAKGACLS